MASRLLWRFFLRHPRLRLFLTRLMVRDRDVPISLFGTTIIINSIKEIGYMNAYKQSRSNKVFCDECGALISLALLLSRGDTFVDVGANVGLYSCILGRIRRLHPEVRFYAFEANSDTASRLRQSVEGLGVSVHNKALSNHDGILELYGGAVSGAFGAADSASHFQSSKYRCRVKASRLDA